MPKAIFLVGAPGSGKDLLLRNVLGDLGLVEMSLDKLYSAISDNRDLAEVNNHRPLIVNGNAERIQAVSQSKAVLEVMGYETAMLYVHTSDQVSKARNDARIARGAKTFSESTRDIKYRQSLEAVQHYNESFDSFWIFNNSYNGITEQVSDWIDELKEEIETFLETQTTAQYVKHMSGPTVPRPVQAPATPHTSNLKGYERVKDGNRWVLKRKATTTESHKYNSSLNQAFETYTATAVDNSRGNVNVSDNGSPTENPATVMAKVQTPKKKTPPGDLNGGGTARSDWNRADPTVWESMSVDIFHGGDPKSKERSEKKAKEAEAKAAKAQADAAKNAPPPQFGGGDDKDQDDDKSPEKDTDDKSDDKDKKPNPFKKKVEEATKIKAKLKKDQPAQGAKAPPDFFDSKMGMVPSGSLGITSEYKPTGTPLSELRKKMRK